MTTITTQRNKVVADDPEPDDVMVFIGWIGPTDDPRIGRRLATSYMPITAYKECLDWAVAIADQMTDPLYVMTLNHRDFFNTNRWNRYREFIATMNDKEREELRHIVVNSMCEVMRDCCDWEIRADAYDILSQMKVIHHES